MLVKTPHFESLPLKKDGPHGNAWGLFGKNDELGMLNRLTPENTIAATREIVHSIRISTDWDLDQPRVPLFNRVSFEQTIHHKAPRTINDDMLRFNTQSSSQWDGFRHFGYQDEKIYFNGCTQDDIYQSGRNGIHVWVENGGIVGRGVLVDYYSWAVAQGYKPLSFEKTEISLSDTKQVVADRKLEFRPGDILFIRGGYVKSIMALSSDDARSLASKPVHAAIGLQAGEEVLKWIWDNQLSAVAGDMPAFESLPFQNKLYWMHEWLLAGWGLPIGELFDLEKLAAECERLHKWTFFFSSVPLKVPGGVASPPNGVAIL